MVINEAIFIGSFGSLKQLPRQELPEVAFVGRSNVGKSSLINKLLGARRLALISSTPGKTRTINFFRVNSACYFVDLPGYGFSKVSKQEQARWRGLIEGYLLGREALRLLILLIDARHGSLANDRRMISWLTGHALPFQVVLTKADKLSGNKLAAEKLALADSAHELHGAVLCSAVKGAGTKEIWRAIDESLCK
jgi:GTP-binding protein